MKRHSQLILGKAAVLGCFVFPDLYLHFQFEPPSWLKQKIGNIYTSMTAATTKYVRDATQVRIFLGSLCRKTSAGTKSSY